MKNFFTTFAALYAALFLPAAVYAQTLNVVTTTTDLKSIAEHIGGDRVRVESLGRGNQNYHFLAAKPSYMIKAKKADLFIVNGLDLEIGYESLILEGSRNRGIQKGQPGYLDASAGIAPLEMPDHVDRSMGDIHAHGNPHYWLDPLNAKIIAANIADRLSELSPDDAPLFSGNLEEFNREIDERMKAWTQRLAPYKGEAVIAYHKSWTYLANRFGFEIAGELEPKPGVPPSPVNLKDIVDLVNDRHIKIILNENIYKDNSARYVAGKTRATVVVAPISVGGDGLAADYFSLIDTIVDNIAKGFET